MSIIFIRRLKIGGWLALLFVVPMFLGGCGGNINKVKAEYLNNQKEFDLIAKSFLCSKIKHLRVRIEYNGLIVAEEIGEWDLVNENSSAEVQWIRQDRFPFLGAMFSYYLGTQKDVMEEIDVSEEEYLKYANFLKKHGFSMISTTFLWTQRQEGVVEIADDGLVGLRYVLNPKEALQVDNEYLIVQKINEHWYAYKRDWN